MEVQKQNKMATMPMTKLILSMSLPAMFSMLVQALYNIVDSYYVAKVSGKAFTAVTLAFPLQMLIISVAVGTAIGINSVVSRRLGEGDKAKASKAATHGLFLGAFSGVIFAIIGVAFTTMFFKAFTDDAQVISMGSSYVQIVTIFSFGIFMQINIEKTLQATGNMIYPMLFQLTGAIINIVLDPIFIFGKFGFPAMGVKGAAIATVIGQISALAFSLIIIYTKSHDVHISLKGFRFEWKTIKDIYAVGIPSIIMQSIGSVVVTGINAILIGFGATAVNVFGAYFKLQSFVFMPVFGLMHGVMPILGFNYGARNKKRMVSALKIGTVFAVFIMLCGTGLFMVFPQQLLRIFNADAQMIAIGTKALRTISICFIPTAIGIMSATLFQAMGMGFKSLSISILRQLVILLPAAFLLSKIGLDYVWFAFPIAESFALVISILMFMYVYKNHIKHLAPTDKKA